VEDAPQPEFQDVTLCWRVKLKSSPVNLLLLGQQKSQQQQSHGHQLQLTEHSRYHSFW
jgi:hypothetical protein